MFPFRDSITPTRKPLINLMLIFFNGCVFLYQIGLSSDELIQWFDKWAIIPAKSNLTGNFADYGIQALSYQFLHGGWAHFVLNMWTLWIFGDNVEDRMRPLGFSLFYLFCGAMGAIGHIIFNPDSSMPLVGASGSISGVMAAYLILYPKSRILTLVPLFFIPLFFKIRAQVLITFWFLIQLISANMENHPAVSSGGVAYWTHIFGFATGAVIVLLFYRQLKPEEEYYY